MKKAWLILPLLLAAVLIGSLAVWGEEQGRDITAGCSLSAGWGGELPEGHEKWLDGKETTYSSVGADEGLEIMAEQVIGGIYLRFDREPKGDVTITCAGKSAVVPLTYLHQYIDVISLLDRYSSLVGLTFSEENSLADIILLSEGEVPDFVQIWEPPCEQADLLLAPTHADDDHLFFLGVLPYYAGELGYEVQVVYYTNHNAVHDRPHELLNGLWTVGVTHYPVIAEMADAWDGESETLDFGYRNFAAQGFEEKELVDFWVKILRRFRPQVVVGHDVKGEYGHPQHMVNTDTLIKALPLSGDESYLLPDSADLPWQPEKVYLHLYGENEIVMDWDKPLAAFGGKTAYEVSKEGYACHRSQQWTWFTSWIEGKYGQYTASTEIRTYSPNRYGLYFTRVGQDSVGGDFFENVTPRSTVPPVTTAPETSAPPQTEPITTAPVATDPVTSEPTPTDPVTPAPTDPSPTEPIDGEEKPSGTDGRWIALAIVALGAAAGAIWILWRGRRK